MSILNLILKWLSVFMMGSRIRLAMWVGSRVATGTGLMLVWNRLKGAPNRLTQFVVWFLALNAVSMLAFLGIVRFVLH